MNFKSLSLLAAAGLCTLSLCGSVSAAELRVATNPTFPPFEFQDSNTGTIQGFEMDLVAEIAKKLGDTVKIDKITFDGIIPAILSGIWYRYKEEFGDAVGNRKRVFPFLY